MKFQALARWKYRLYENEVFAHTGVRGYSVRTRYIELFSDGRLEVLSGYCWDGPSGPTIDRSTNMRGSLAHDALYQLLREMQLPHRMRFQADRYLLQCWLEDGMWPWLARLEVWLVMVFGGASAEPDAFGDPKIKEAP